MDAQVSKSNFKAHALEIMRDIEQSGDGIVITSHGTPCLVVNKYCNAGTQPLNRLKTSVINFTSPTDPVGDDDWELA